MDQDTLFRFSDLAEALAESGFVDGQDYVINMEHVQWLRNTPLSELSWGVTLTDQTEWLSRQNTSTESFAVSPNPQFKLQNTSE